MKRAGLLLHVMVWLALQTPQPPPEELTRPDSGARETAWSAYLAQEIGGEPEHRTSDGSRVDILTDSHAWEVEWADKWAEAVGQVLFYSEATHKPPAILMLMRDSSDIRPYLRCRIVCTRLDIPLHTVDTRTGKIEPPLGE